MPELIAAPTRIDASRGKTIEEYVGRAATETTVLSIAHMRAEPGWSEPGQTPDFDEYTLVLRGTLVVEHRHGRMEVKGGQGVIARAGEWVRYGTEEPCEYVAVCFPAFSPESAHRDPA